VTPDSSDPIRTSLTPHTSLTPQETAMSRRRIVLTVLAVALVLLTIHVTINGFPALSSLNPHAR
jgi:hypothetical protein